jgi:uncharacterized membrane protein YccC
LTDGGLALQRVPHTLRDQLVAALRAAGPPLLFGLRMWVAVCLALTVAFWLELNNAFWAGAAAAIVCQPVLGASLRKGWFRMVGTVVGAVAAVVLSGLFPQSRAGFLFCLALWCGICTGVATILRNFGSYAAALASLTAVIIAADQMGAVGGINGNAFLLAVTRATETCIGIASAGIVLAGTDFGGARRRLATALGNVSAEITGRLVGSFSLARSEQSATASVRRDLTRRVGGLDAIADAARGEASDLRANPQPLRAAMDGLFSALSGWSAVANHLATIPEQRGAQASAAILQVIPTELRASPVAGGSAIWTSDPEQIRRLCNTAIRALVALRAGEPSLQLLADRTAEALLGVRHAIDALILLHDLHKVVPRQRIARVRVADWLPAVISGVRAFITVGATAILWIVTAWPSGAFAMVLAAAVIAILVPRGAQAYAAATTFLAGTVAAVAVAAIVVFAILPAQPSYAGFCLTLGMVLIPFGAMTAQPWHPLAFVPVAFLFLTLAAPTNQMTYNTQQFYNTAMALTAGVGVAALGFRLIPPLSTPVRSGRLLALMLHDLRRMAGGAALSSWTNWEGRVHACLAAMPDDAGPLRWAWLAANETIGTAIMRLRRAAGRFGAETELAQALQPLARGDNAMAIAALSRLDAALAAQPTDRPGAKALLQARGTICIITETLTRHAAYFDSP